MDKAEKQKNYELAEKLLAEQNFSSAVIAGVFAAVVAAVAYGIVVERWPLVYGFAAAGVGFAVGLPMGILGRGIATRFSIAAAVLTIGGCVLGNLFVSVVNLMRATATPALEVVQGASLSELARWSMSGFSLIHLVSWFVAVFAAVFLAKRSLSRSERLAIRMLDIKI